MAGEMQRSQNRNVLLALFVLVVLVIVTSYLFVLLMGYGLMFFTTGGITVSSHVYEATVLLFFFVLGFVVPTLGGFMFLSVFLVYVACFIAAWKWRESFPKAVKNAFSRPFRGLFNNFLFAMPLLSSMVFTAVLFIIYAQQAVGIGTGEPNFGPGASQQYIFLNVAYAPPVEELGFRLVPIGLFLVLYIFLTRKKVDVGRFKLFLASVFYPDGAKRMAGLPNVSEHGIRRGISNGEWIMIAGTTIIFAVAHILSGIGWEVGKITSVLVQGFFFALTYLAYGFEAPILLHWFFNYYSFFLDENVLSSFFPGTLGLFGSVELLILLLGIIGWIIFTVVGLRTLFRGKRTQPTATPSFPSQPPPTPPASPS